MCRKIGSFANVENAAKNEERLPSSNLQSGGVALRETYQRLGRVAQSLHREKGPSRSLALHPLLATLVKKWPVRGLEIPRCSYRLVEFVSGEPR
jgi:hypothetical protein